MHAWNLLIPAFGAGYELPGVRGARIQAARDETAMLEHTRRILTTIIACG